MGDRLIEHMKERQSWGIDPETQIEAKRKADEMIRIIQELSREHQKELEKSPWELFPTPEPMPSPSPKPRLTKPGEKIIA